MHHNNSLCDLMKLLNQDILDKAIKAHQSDRFSKNLDTKTHLIAGIFMQLMNPHGLREVELQLRMLQGTLAPKGFKSISKSSLSDANRTRNADVFRDILLELIPQNLPEKKNLQDCLSIIDSSTLSIKGPGTEWAEQTKTRSGCGLKIHVEYLLNEDTINTLSISPSNVNDITAAINQIQIQPGWVYVYDKAYADYNWWHMIHVSGAFFVTRPKKNAKIRILSKRKLDKKSNPYILADKYVQLSNKKPRGGKDNKLASVTLRLIEAIDPITGKKYSFITNMMAESASKIAGYYKRRWSIELLFKWIKQNLKIKKFHSQNENGIKIQIYIAIITYLLINMMKKLYGKAYNRTIDLVAALKAKMFAGTSKYFTKRKPELHRSLSKRNLELQLKL